MNAAADRFFSNAKKWKQEMILLRQIILDCQLEETFKWMHPCYAKGDKNIVLIHGFKDYCALLFFKGVLLKDSKSLLIQQTKNVQDRRQLRFTSPEEIVKMQKTITAYIKEAVEIELSGQKVHFKKTAEFEMPEEFRLQLDKNKKLKTAFDKLTPGRQRGYLLHFAAAKQSATRISRIEKYIPQILAGRGIND
jgi:uncharacterized protein YdeI (YjbR/CyaY-like superfamily)